MVAAREGVYHYISVIIANRVALIRKWALEGIQDTRRLTFCAHQQVLMPYADENGKLSEPWTSAQAALLSPPPPVSSHMQGSM